MRRAVKMVGLACGCCVYALASADPRTLVVNHWVCDMVTEQVVRHTIKVGCDFVSPTLGCPSANPLSLDFDFQAPLNSTATLTVTNATQSLQFKVAGQASTSLGVNPPPIVMKPGSATLSGFLTDTAQVPTVSITIKAPQSAFNVMPNPWLSGLDAAGKVHLDVKQIVGDYKVGSTQIRHAYHACTSRSAVDEIRIAGSTSAVALIDGRISGACLPNAGYRGGLSIPLPNLLTQGTCLERVTVFGNEGALQFRKQSSDSLGDQLSAFLNDSAQQKLDMPAGAMAEQQVRIWVVYDPCRVAGACTPGVAKEMEKRPKRHIDNAMRIYRQQFSGITFKIHDIQSVRAENDGISIQCDNNQNTPTTLTKLQALTQLTEAEYRSKLNIFYVKDPHGYGIWCGAHDAYGIGRDTILIGATAKTRTLAHELGHALLWSGEHVYPGEDGFSDPSINLMTEHASGDELTLGQIFRANLLPDSTLNRHGARGLPRATCSAAASSPDSCPALWVTSCRAETRR